MTAIINPFIDDPTIATQPLPFLLDAARFLRDLHGSHRLEEAPPLEPSLPTSIIEMLKRHA